MSQNRTSAKSYESRREARYPVEMDIIIFSGKDFVRGKTLNISSFGLQLAVPVPETFRGSPLEIVMGSENEFAHFDLLIGQVVDSSGVHLSVKNGIDLSRVTNGPRLL